MTSNEANEGAHAAWHAEAAGAEAAGAEAAGGATVRIILVRHGLTTWNMDRRYQGQIDVPLSDQGLIQARAVARRLSSEIVHRVYSSDLSRARMTAQEIAACHGLDVMADGRLREMRFGDWEGLTFDEIERGWPDLLHRWLEDPVTLSAPGGETALQLGERVGRALKDIYSDLSSLKPGKDGAGGKDGGHRRSGHWADEQRPCGVIVSHGGVIRSLMALGTEGSMTSLWSRGVRQASVTIGELSPSGLAITTWDDATHLA
jgi:broad specificity phosphatase PhoE